ncbi:MAG: anaerobic glycerol-3-phosphate dehydrogenase C subunit [Mariniblastus sp.]|jgi:anaerobic glycerol-3-phosphate dehydrogenase C subunit
MDPERARIQADLSGQLEGDVRCDVTFLQMYASDASIYEIVPLGVIRPASTEDVVTCVKYAEENQISLIPRGAGSNVAGACVGQGLILDFSYSMRRIQAVGKDTVTVQPGVVLGDLNRQLKRHGQFFGPDPATRNVTTVGGTLAMNTSGSHWIRYGSPRDTVMRLKVVMTDGEVVEFDSCENVAATNSIPTLRAQLLAGQVKRVLTEHEDLIKEKRPQTKQNQAGYNLFDLQRGNQTDLTRLLVGSEGTLGIITEAVLKTEPLPRHRGVALLFFHRLESAAKAAVEINKMGISACDLLDRRLLSLARETNSDFQQLIPADAEAMLLVEYQASDENSLRSKLDHLVVRIQKRKKLAYDVRVATQREQRDLYWRIVRRIVPTLYRLKGDKRALPFVEDIAVEPSRIPEFLSAVHKVLNDNEVTASIFCHAPQGTIHIRPFMSLSDPAEIPRMHRLAKQLFEQVLEFKGTVSGRHGDGLSRTWFLRRQYGQLYNVFSDVKKIFDPHNVFNPGKIVGHPFTGLGDNLRRVVVSDAFLGSDFAANQTATEANAVDETPEASNENSEAVEATADQADDQNRKTGWLRRKRPDRNSSLPILEPELNWQLPQIALAARNCNGCGRCRSGTQHERMCPVFRLAPREESSPRAKANLMRGIVTGQLEPSLLASDEFKEIADLCVNCHQCRLECPAGVDVPKLMVEAKAQYYATNGMKLSDWMLTRLDWLYEIAGQMPMVTNRLLKNKMARWLLDKTLGISQGRKLPLFSKTSFARWAQRRKLSRPSKQQARKIVFFHDAYVNWNDVELGQAFVKVLKHNGIDVVVPSGQNVSGMSLISEGSIVRAKKLAEKNVELLAEWVRQGYQIVTTEPSAALALKHEYLNLLDDQDAQIVAENTVDATTFLLHLHLAGDLELDFRPVNAAIGYHLPCHQRALGEDVPAMKLLRLIPGLQVELIEKGCSGMAGTFGIKRKNYLRSLRIGFALINAMRSTDIIAGTTECSTCKIQMEQGTTKPTVHPIKIMAMAYGLMPELEDLFNRRSGDLVVS